MIVKKKNSKRSNMIFILQIFKIRSGYEIEEKKEIVNSSKMELKYTTLKGKIVLTIKVNTIELFVLKRL